MRDGRGVASGRRPDPARHPSARARRGAAGRGDRRSLPVDEPPGGVPAPPGADRGWVWSRFAPTGTGACTSGGAKVCATRRRSWRRCGPTASPGSRPPPSERSGRQRTRGAAARRRRSTGDGHRHPHRRADAAHQRPTRDGVAVLDRPAAHVRLVGRGRRARPAARRHVPGRDGRRPGSCVGEYVELVPHERIVFTFGWEPTPRRAGRGRPAPPGSRSPSPPTLATPS